MALCIHRLIGRWSMLTLPRINSQLWSGSTLSAQANELSAGLMSPFHDQPLLINVNESNYLFSLSWNPIATWPVCLTRSPQSLAFLSLFLSFFLSFFLSWMSLLLIDGFEPGYRQTSAPRPPGTDQRSKFNPASSFFDWTDLIFFERCSWISARFQPRARSMELGRRGAGSRPAFIASRPPGDGYSPARSLRAPLPVPDDHLSSSELSWSLKSPNQKYLDQFSSRVARGNPSVANQSENWAADSEMALASRSISRFIDARQFESGRCVIPKRMWFIAYFCLPFPKGRKEREREGERKKNNLKTETRTKEEWPMWVWHGWCQS